MSSVHFTNSQKIKAGEKALASKIKVRGLKAFAPDNAFFRSSAQV
jgi:hypothetical protein